MCGKPHIRENARLAFIAKHHVRLFEGLHPHMWDAVSALPVESAVLDGEAVILRPDNSFDFEALRSRQGQEEAMLVAYDIMEGERAGRAP